MSRNLGARSAGSGFVESDQARDPKVRHGRHVTVAADDSVSAADLGLTTVSRIVVSLESDPTTDPDRVTAVVAADGSSVNIKTWKPTATADTAPIAATTFAVNVAYIAWGT